MGVSQEQRSLTNAAFPERRQATRRLCRYGVTPEQFDQMLADQNGVCAICGEPETRMRLDVLLPLSVDHDHVTGRVRGLLCHPCNQAIGFFKDDPERLVKAIEYLRRTA